MTAISDKSALKPYFRWLVLAIMSLICFAQYFIYDSVTPLGSLIKAPPAQGGLGFSGSQYGLLFSAYAVANVFLLMLLIAGVLVDKLGLKKSGIFYGFLCFLGAALTALGAMESLPHLLGPVYEWLRTAFLPEWSPQLKVMLLGRAIYGVGAEAILVVNNKVLARWFKGKELAFAYGLNLTIMRLGTFLALNIQAPVAKHWGLRNALWFAAFIMLIGFSTYFLYLWLERKARGREGAPIAEGGLALAGAANQPEEKFRLKEIFSFSPSFWFISLLCVTFYSAVFPFQAYAPDILVQKFKYSEIMAGTIASALIFGTMIFTPIFGWLVDRFGKRAKLMMLGSLLLIPCHLLLGYTYIPPIIPIFVVGIALSLVPAALWAAIPMMVPEKRLGTAFGVIGYIQNVGLMLFPYIAGRISDAHTTQKVINGQNVAMVDYTSTMLMFALLGVVGFVFAILLKRADSRRQEGQSIDSVMRG
ncbi:MAG: MFS transporter [Acidobacteria bacterium]|nr:MFS transporter [Acidobacteriota bacterium]MBU4306319.1 MFS transporter [Acidobacteriota bacterium]MBU4405606.1 MFS transporter [Acidobacteriota bacterium]MCG2810786.1 MFS transporter [Candidatus Aminicenantes bacterium]